MDHWFGRTAALITATSAALSLTIAGPATALLAGSDVASHQHPGALSINWARVKAAGHDFAIVKATEGISYVNPHYHEDSISMRKAGLIRGTYHYALPQYSAILQAQHYAAVLATNTTNLDLPPVLDLEETGGLGPRTLQAWVRTFLTTLDVLTSRQTIIYVSPGFWRYQMGDTKEFANRPLWIADYNGEQSPTLPLPGGWRTWTFWQYTGSGQVNGVATPIDLNTFNGTKEQLLALTNYRESVKPKANSRQLPATAPRLPAIRRENVPDIWKLIPPEVQRQIKRDIEKRLREVSVTKATPGYRNESAAELTHTLLRQLR